MSAKLKMRVPIEILSFVDDKANKNGGRPHFLNQLKKKRRDPLQDYLNILELSWIKGRSNLSIAKHYKKKGFRVDQSTIFRMVKAALPHQDKMIEFLEKAPSRKTFYNKKTNMSDYETVQNYIDRARRKDLSNYRRNIQNAKRCWVFLKKANPSNWTADQVLDYLATLSGSGAKSTGLDAIRVIAPQIRDDTSTEYIATGRFREQINIRKKPLFAAEMKILRDCLKEKKMYYHLLINDFHVTGAFREGSTDTESGITGISWGRFHKNYTLVDDYEKKSGKVFWRDCPVDLFFKDLPRRLRKLYNERGKPKPSDKIILGGYKELLKIYQEIRETLKEHLKGKVDPDVYQEFITLNPHDADKIHCNLLWEAGAPLEVVAGQFLGRGEGIGLVGRGWKSLDVLKKHYLSLTQRSPKFKAMRAKIDEYAGQF